MSLAEYKKKRKFSNTPEPEGKVKKFDGKKLIYAMQKHQAS